MHDDDEWVPVSHGNCGRVEGPFYHGTRADLSVGDLLTAGFASNYDERVLMNHVYFTTVPKGAGLAAEMARGAGRPRVYVVAADRRVRGRSECHEQEIPGQSDALVSKRCAAEDRGRAGKWESHDAEFVRELRRRVGAGMGEIIN